MFQMKEDVENEFSERMEQLRDMYKTEIEQLMSKLETERSTAKALEVILLNQNSDKRSFF